MTFEDYRRRLLEQERELVARLGRDIGTARDVHDDQPEPGDLATVDELKDEYFTIAQTDAEILTQVRDALRRIDDRTFGKCVVCGAPIAEKRLQAVPWTPFCLKHQEEAESRRQLRTPTM